MFRHRSTVTCKYITYSDPITKQTYKLPMVNVELTHKTVSIKSVALIDSGATSNFLPIELAEVLDLDLSKKPTTAVGAGGTFNSIVSMIGKCQLVKGKNTPFEVFSNLHLNIPVDEDTLPYMILGRDSVFRKFDIKFQERNEKIIFKRIEP